MKLPRIRIALLLKLALAGTLVAAVAIVVLLPRRTGVEGWSDRAAPRANTVTTDAALRAAFASAGPQPGSGAYETLARYFLEGWAGYRTPAGERAHYPGPPSESGRRSDGLEGFARMFPMAGAWMAGGRPAGIEIAGGRMDLAETFARGLATGTDPADPAYWGPIRDYGQAIVESADVALGLWLSRDSVWARLSPAERSRVVAWLEGALRSEPYEGNWQLFPLIVHRSLKALGADVSRWDARMQSSWEYFKTFHRGEGWFFDPPHGFDYYNAWSIHYGMFWLQRIDPGFDPTFVRKVQADFVASYKHFFGPQGQPLMGRSVCYRMAAPVPLLTAQVLAPGAVSKGEAMRALDLTWSLFIARGAVADGGVTPGFCGPDLAMHARYSGPASCLWALRSLVVAFALDRELKLFDATREPLPVERADFSLRNETAGWTLAGSQATGRIALVTDSGASDEAPALKPHGLRSRALETLLHAPRRPDNTAALYGRKTYSSDRPLGRCDAMAPSNR
jgi:hypothetical protein